MFESIKELDAALLLFFNHMNNPVFDFFFYWMSNRWIWIPLYILLAWVLRTDFKNRLFVQLVFIAIMITLSDQLASSVLKNFVMRLRPCHDPSIAASVHLVNGYCGGMYGFVSSHASNTFSLATFFAFLYKSQRRTLQNWLWLWAVVVSFSRIYLGAHFPGDVIAGACLGLLLGWLTVLAYHYLITKFHRLSSPSTSNHAS